jgi:Leucine-rich repeat (LRR) protein
MHLDATTLPNLICLESAKNSDKIDLSNKKIAQIHDISPIAHAHRLNFADNSLNGSTDSLQGLKRSSQLTWLDLSRNQMDTLDGVRGLDQLTVLSASHNQLTCISQSSVTGLSKLKALILNNNSLHCIDALSKLPHLNTLGTPLSFLYSILYVDLWISHLNSIQLYTIRK